MANTTTSAQVRRSLAVYDALLTAVLRALDLLEDSELTTEHHARLLREVAENAALKADALETSA